MVNTQIISLLVCYYTCCISKATKTATCIETIKYTIQAVVICSLTVCSDLYYKHAPIIFLKCSIWAAYCTRVRKCIAVGTISCQLSLFMTFYCLLSSITSTTPCNLRRIRVTNSLLCRSSYTIHLNRSVCDMKSISCFLFLNNQYKTLKCLTLKNNLNYKINKSFLKDL